MSFDERLKGLLWDLIISGDIKGTDYDNGETYDQKVNEAFALVKQAFLEIMPEKHIAMEDEILDNMSKGWNAYSAELMRRIGK